MKNQYEKFKYPKYYKHTGKNEANADERDLQGLDCLYLLGLVSIAWGTCALVIVRFFTILYYNTKLQGKL